MEEICRIILGWAKDVLGATKGMILIRESQYQGLNVVASVPHFDKDIKGVRIRFGDGVVGRAAETNKPVILKQPNTKMEKGLLDPYLPPPVIAVPMKGDGGVIGVITLTRDDEFTSKDLKLMQAIATQSGIALRNLRLFNDLKEFFFSTVRALASTIDAKDPYTEGHSERVANYSLAIGEEMGLGKDEMEVLHFSALLHDIGKLRVPIEILHKPDKLSEDEYKVVKDHPLHGVQILKHIREFEKILPGVWHHHETYKGDGYPAGLLGDDIPLVARIIAVADAFDAMTSDRPYRPAISLKASLVEIQEAAESKYDPKVISAFVSAFNKGKIRKEIPEEEEKGAY
jgi:putative nucleotidyltransferase with HDIG domain